jgi:NitT/TauT family transport system ATP-binding protein
MLLMDEPFAALDALTRERMQEELLELWDETRSTILFVTHSIQEAIRIGNRILLLSAHPGQVKAELQGIGPGEPAERAGALEARVEEILFNRKAKGGDAHAGTS